ncbi:hypothetical protein ANN_11116 [Periplaneta americana]|uniref:Uncharacterized protein n=1 Tax=Periplaneta americana TaxID=6978 RepID=A0ABQ8T5U5_PERAM|nr:hypothetical protein ANN_11116 [Periplaneta americana]
MAGLCEGGNEPSGSLKAISCFIGYLTTAVSTQLFDIDEIDDSEAVFSQMRPKIHHRFIDYLKFTLRVERPSEKFNQSLMLAGNEFQSLGRAIVKEDEYEEVRWDGIVSIVSWRERVFRLWWEESLKHNIIRGATAREGPRPTSRLLASRPHAESEVDDHPTRKEVSCG